MVVPWSRTSERMIMREVIAASSGILITAALQRSLVVIIIREGRLGQDKARRESSINKR
jgi:hypothetical protein